MTTARPDLETALMPDQNGCYLPQWWRDTAQYALDLEKRLKLLEGGGTELIAAERARQPPMSSDVQWWLAELDRYGNPKLVDGAHSSIKGARDALDIRRALDKRIGPDGKPWPLARTPLSVPPGGFAYVRVEVHHAE